MMQSGRSRVGALAPVHWNLVGGLVCFLALFVLTSCADDNPAAPENEDEKIPTDLTDPAEVIGSHAKALSQKDYAAYAALLAPEFEFFPLEDVEHDFPWFGENSWGATTELSIMQHMFDPNFQSAAQRAAQTVRFHATILDVRTFESGEFEVTCTCQGQVLTGEDDGWAFDTRLVFQLVLRNGFLRIRQISELETLRPNGLREVESASWGWVKSLYL